MPRRFRLVDVFSETPFLGNPVAVVLDADGLATDEMQRITRWMNLSETTFLLPPTTPDADYRVRIFTLEREMPFAGHPTLGSCQAWLSAGGLPARAGKIVQECGAGLIPIRSDGEHLAFAAPPLIRDGALANEKKDEIARALRIDPDRFVDAAWIDNGPGWAGVLLASAESVLALEPISSHPTRLEIGVVGPYPAGSEMAFELRAFFSDQHGTLREDPVTGSLNASVAQWLLASGRATAPYVASQGTAVGREGRIFIHTDDANTVWVGGNAITIVEGQIDI